MTPLFDDPPLPSREPLEEGARCCALSWRGRRKRWWNRFGRIAAASPFRHLVTPGGYTMSVAMTNCGRVGWVSDRKGYRYDAIDPDTSAPWPPMPPAFLEVAARAAAEEGFTDYDPDACLINRYAAGAKRASGSRREGRMVADCLRIAGAAGGVPVGRAAPGTRSGGCAWRTATWWRGAARRGSCITAWRRSRPASIRRPAMCG